MLGTHDLLLFVASGVLLNITPGPDMLYVVARSSAQGARAGAAAALGIAAGCVVHIMAAAFGLSAVITASATAFTALKVLGAIYLVYVGLSLIWTTRTSPKATIASAALAPANLRAIFVQGFLTNALNPKVALFFLALLPQFIDADAPNKALAFLFLGAIFNLNGTLWNLLVAWSAARFGTGLGRTRIATWLNRCIGGILVYIGIRIAFARQA
jgi:threonine/homoserine/homoserine lactone efflux protein